jgi:hypothetical protein
MSFQTKFTFMWTRTSRRSPPLYAKTLMKNMRRERVSLDPPRGQTGPLIPPTPPACLPNPNICEREEVSQARKNPFRVERRDFKEQVSSPPERGLICKKNLLECDLCASCFESCLCLISCLLVDLLKKCCWSRVNEILSFLESE